MVRVELAVPGAQGTVAGPGSGGALNQQSVLTERSHASLAPKAVVSSVTQATHGPNFACMASIWPNGG